MSDTDVKFCIDCRYCNLRPRGIFRIFGDMSRCMHPAALKKYDSDLGDYYVTGKSKNVQHYCSTMRLSDCGRKATLFEGK